MESLPREILVFIFEKLSHNEKLIARLVRKDWNDQITNILRRCGQFSLTSKLAETEYIKIHGDGSQNPNLEVHLKWTPPWRSLKIRGEFLHLVMTPESAQALINLRIEMENFSMEKCLNFALQFPNLSSLEMHILSSAGVNYNPLALLNSPVIRKAKPKYRKFFESLKEFSVWIPYQDYNVLADILLMAGLPTAKLKLSKLSITELKRTVAPDEEEVYTPLASADVSFAPGFFAKNMFALILKSQTTLKSLTMVMTSSYFHSELVFPVMRKMTDEIPGGVLKLEEFLISPAQVIAGTGTEARFLIHEGFLKTQISSLRKLTLPWCSSNPIENQAFVFTLNPKQIEFIQEIHDENLTYKFPLKFEKLTEWTLSQDFDARVEFGQEMQNPMLRPDIHTLSICPKYADIVGVQNAFYTHLSHILTNLTILIIRHNGVKMGIGNVIRFHDAELQCIIRQFQHLKKIWIENASAITDFGISGIRQNQVHRDLVELPKARGALRNPENKRRLALDLEQVSFVGVPIHTLKSLESLTIKNSQITDIGIYFGLKFGNRLKELVLCSRSFHVSDWSLHWIGVHNPRLEVLNVHFSGIEIPECLYKLILSELRSQLPLITITGRLEFKIKFCNHIIITYARSPPTATSSD